MVVLVLFVEEMDLMLFLCEGLNYPVSGDVFLRPGVHTGKPLPLLRIIRANLLGIGIGNEKQHRENAAEDQGEHGVSA